MQVYIFTVYYVCMYVNYVCIIMFSYMYIYMYLCMFVTLGYKHTQIHINIQYKNILTIHSMLLTYYVL